MKSMAVRMTLTIALIASVSWCVWARIFSPGVENIRDWMADSVVRLNTIERDGKHYTATGFFFRSWKDGDPTKSMVVLMTNRHVLSNAIAVTFAVPLKEDGKRSATKCSVFRIAGGDIHVEYHPDPSVDLCALLVNHEIKAREEKGVALCYCAFDNSFLADSKFYEEERQLDPVVMVGHPNGLIDTSNLQPIFRRGVYATRPLYDYCGRQEFLLDIPNFGGSSGSPVFHFDDRKFDDRTMPGVNIRLASRLVLVGVSHAGWAYNPKTKISVGGTNRTDVVVTSEVFNNTAYVIKTSRIREIDTLLNEKYK